MKLSSGPDRIPHIVYRRLAAVLAHPLYLIFKESVNTGILPKLWKEAEVLPIFKNGSRTSVDNYRPISLTCVACRALERLICKKLYDYCCKWSIISANQHGFQRRRSTITQLLECMNVWTHAFENKEIVKIAYLDFRKAFDTVSHTKLLSVLENKGIRGDPLRWIKDFLAFRTQTVVINNCRSLKRSVTSGVPQGSVLGPLLFILYINDLILASNRSSVYVFADDSKIFLSMSKDNLDDDSLQADLNRISLWAESRQLTLSVPKCKILTINGANNYPFTLQGVQLENVHEAKDLGILIDSKLHFDSQCIQIVKKAGSILHFLFYCFKTRDVSFMVRLYQTFVLPVLEYGVIIFNPWTVKNIRLLESVQRYFTRR